MKKAHNVVSIIFWTLTAIFATLMILTIWGVIDEDFGAKVFGTYAVLFFSLIVTGYVIRQLSK